MGLRDYGIGKRELRQGSGLGGGSDHVDEIFGCTEFYLYKTLKKNIKGLGNLILYLESQGCEVICPAEGPTDLGDRYETIRVIRKEGEPIPVPVVKRVHSWAHRHNLLHSFFKPLYR
jgi:hypothetical protein